MEINEGLTTRLWLEEYKNQASAPSQKSHYQTTRLKLSKKQITALNSYLQKNKITWKQLISAAWGLLLNRFSSTDSIVFGYLESSSTQILPITSLLNGKLSIKAFIAKFRRSLEKKPSRSTIGLIEEIRYLLLVKGAQKSKKYQSMIDPSRFPLILSVDKKLSATITLQYNSTSFSEQNSKHILQYLVFFLLEIVANKTKLICKLNSISEEEKQQILRDWNHPIYHFTTHPLLGCCHDLFLEQALLKPDNLFIQHNDTQLTYREMDKASTALATQLIEEYRIKLGDRVCVLMDRTPDLLIAMLAIFKSGAIYVPINPKYPDERIEFILDDSQPTCSLVNDKAKLPENYREKLISLNQSWHHLQIASDIKLPEVDSESIAYIIYTSGTTGKPKGVMIRHKSLTNLIAWYRSCFEVTEKDRSVQFASQGFDTFLCETIPYLASGASIHIVDDNIKLTPPLFFEWLDKNKITISDLPTSYAQMLLSMAWPSSISMRIMKMGGETVTHYPTQKLPFDVWNGYGPTEITIEATYFKLYDAKTATPPFKHIPPPIGKPITNVETYIVDSYLQPVPVGICGELLIGGAGVAVGYLNREDLTKEKFIPHIFKPNTNEKLYRTGDLARWLPDGNIEFMGRIDHQVKIRGFRVELGDIEHAISQHTDVHEVVVLAKENLNNEKSLIAYVVPNLDKQRYLYQERCLLSINQNKYIEVVTEDISKSGVALSGVTESFDIGQAIQLHLKLPGFTDAKLLNGNIIWQQDNRCGIAFDLNDEEKVIITKSIEYYISSHNVMELVLSASAKRNLRKALRKKLPDYMVPSVFVSLLEFPLTFSGKIDVKALPPPQEFEQILQQEYIAPKTDTEKKLTTIWSNILHRKSISMSDNFFDIGGTSLSAAELSVAILNQFNISIPAKILFDLSYIPILAEYIDTRGEKYNDQSIIQEEIQRDCILHDNIIPTNKLSKHIHQPEHILLTGAGGFLGIYMLRELLKTTQAKIYCLIRKGEFESAAKRLISTLKRFNLNDEISLNDRRIVIIASDLSLDHFGMPLELYTSLINKIDLIYHCGAQVNIMASYNKLRGSNVKGTLEVIKFATTGMDKPIHYISTLSSAYLKDANGSLAEEFPDEHYDELFGGYAISKWVSERLLNEIKNRGLPISIYRSGYISGQSDTGMTNLNDALLMLIKGSIQLGYAPDFEEKITILPVDFVSHAIVEISLAFPDASAVYHIDHPKGILWSDLVAWINDYGYQVKIIPLKEWKQKLLSIPQDNALFPFLPYYLALPDNYRPPLVNTEKASQALQKINIAYPKLDDALLSIYFDYLCQIKFLPLKGDFLHNPV